MAAVGGYGIEGSGGISGLGNSLLTDASNFFSNLTNYGEVQTTGTSNMGGLFGSGQTSTLVLLGVGALVLYLVLK